MSLYQKILLACLYVLNFDTPVDIEFTHGGHTYRIYNYIETSSSGLEVGVDICIDETKDSYLYDDLWWSIRCSRKTNYSRLNEAVTAIVNAEKRGFTVEY